MAPCPPLELAMQVCEQYIAHFGVVKWSSPFMERGSTFVSLIQCPSYVIDSKQYTTFKWTVILKI
jgi:hypothetical protein